ncbi:hypothetical protein [Williamwhitmania taraxaci]|uniref:Long-chain fatty acid transport protein n=1 Tax=Williamwhitmania taraxaci TaxID=1640674 RepID=A0A1G6L5U9_9BACT|nr:hypothetical protein [Williamwhitmania taraxaci]SDC38521.1 hypothetical protein SAMN05216323_10299 [Williamwhitmania taraxaci]
MLKTNRFIAFAVFFLVVCQAAFPQNSSTNTFSPYSIFGLGDPGPKGFTRSRAMGGINTGIRSSSSINFENPAALTEQDSLSFMLDFGFGGYAQNLSSSEGNASNSSFNIQHFAFSFPVTKWCAASMGVLPYSNVGYKMFNREMDPVKLSTIGNINYINEGEGGISKMFIAAGFKVLPYLHLGATMNYYFGNITRTSSIIYPTQALYLDMISENKLSISHVNIKLGAQVIKNLDDDKSMVFGITYEPERKTTLLQELYTRAEKSGRYDTVSYSKNHPKITLPSTLSMGVTYNQKDKLNAGMDVIYQDWSNASLPTFSGNFNHSASFRVGVEYTPSRFDLKSYLKHISYRAGAYYTSPIAKINNTQINDYGITFGAGLPFKNTKSSLNLSVETGQRGSKTNNLIKENYTLFSVSLIFYDFWFFKPKFN